MFRILLFLMFISFTCTAQSFLGKNREEIEKMAYEELRRSEIDFEIINDSISVIRIYDSFELLSYYLLNDVCVKFVVSRPKSCSCLGRDIMSYNSKLISIGKMRWRNHDSSKIYQLLMYRDYYTVTIIEKKTESNVELLSQLLEPDDL